MAHVMGPSGSSRFGVARWLRGLVGMLATALVLTVVAAVAIPVSARADAGLVWSAPVLVDHAVPRAGNSGGIGPLACPSVSLCVGFDDLGNLVMSTRPAAVRTWHTAQLPGAAGVFADGVSCPSVSFCVALASTYGGAGRVVVSTAPSAGARAWHIERVPDIENPYAISCPSTTLCVGVEASGNVLTSTDPDGGGAAWHVTHIDSTHSMIGKADLESVSCPSVAFCVVVDDAGNVFSSSDPTGGDSAWSRAQLVTGTVGDSAVSCPSTSLCVADVQGTVLTSTNPLGGTPAWTQAQVVASSIAPTISCPSDSLCVAGGFDSEGRVLSSASPTEGRATWHQTLVDGINGFNAISCPSVAFCAVVDTDGNVLVGTPARVRLAVPVVIVRQDGLSATAKRRGSRVSVDSGLSIGCPRGRAACEVKGKASDITLSDRQVPIGRLHVTIRPGERRKIVFLLSQSGARLLLKKKLFQLTELQIVARLSGGLAVADEPGLTLYAPT